jgi:hypothetical protein
MIPVVAQPPARFVQVPPDRLRRVKSRSTLVGVAFIPLSLVIGATGVPWAFGLPTSYDPLTFVVAAVMGVSSLFSLLIGALALAGRSCVKTGSFNVTFGRNLRRAALVFWLGTALNSGFGCAAMALMVATSSNTTGHPPVEFSPEILSYLGLLVLPVALSGAAWIMMLRTLRP